MKDEVWADQGSMWVWTKESDHATGVKVGHVVPRSWVEKGYVRQEKDKNQVDLLDLIGG